MTEPNTQPSTQRRRPAVTFLMDFALGLLVFSAVVGAFSITSSNAFPGPPPVELLGMGPAMGLAPSPAAFVPLLSDVALTPRLQAGLPTHTYILLALAFSTLTAFNLAVWRHLRTAYASPRRRA
jgi:hypothetical protein